MLNLTPGPIAPCWDCNRLVCSGIEVRGQGVSDLNRKAYSCRTTHRKQTITHHLRRRRNPGQYARVCVGVCVLRCPRNHTRRHTSEDQHTQPDGDREVTEEVTICYLLRCQITCWKVTSALCIMHVLCAPFGDALKRVYIAVFVLKTRLSLSLLDTFIFFYLTRGFFCNRGTLFFSFFFSNTLKEASVRRWEVNHLPCG